MKRFISTSLLALFPPPNTAVFSWGAVTTYADGTAIPSTVPVTYNLYTGNASGAETLTQSGITGLTVTTSGYADGTKVYGYVTAVANGVEGGHSNEASKSFPAVPGTTTLSVQ
jgi:hypothetical protein